MNIKENLLKETWQEDCPGVLQTGIPLALAFLGQNEHYDKKYQKYLIVMCKDNYLWEITSQKEKDDIFEYLKDKPDFVMEKVEEWKKIRKELFKEIEEINMEDLSKLDNDSLNKKYQDFVKIAGKSWSYPIMAESFDHFSTHHLIPKLSEELKIGEDEARELCIILSMSEKLSFLEEEKLNLLKISLMEETNHELKNHASSYFWFANNYAETQVLDEEYFIEEIRELKKLSVEEREDKIKDMENYSLEIHRQKEKYKGKYNISKELTDIFQILEIFSWWVDRRKVVMLNVFHAQFVLLKEIGFRLKIENPKYLMRKEVEDGLNGKPIENSIINERISASVYSMDSDYNENIIQGKEASDLIETYFSKFEHSEINGVVASKGDGNTEGNVNIVMNVNTDEFIEGNILVTSMTRPEFVPLMRKAKGIITEEGGITCHAAIVSRELGIPCIIGTKVATRVLKNGQNVEMDIENGKVRVK